MCKKTSEQEDSILGKTEWWRLQNDYEVIIKVKYNIMIICSNVNNKSEDVTMKIFNLINSKLGMECKNYRLETAATGGYGIYFPPEKKMYTLELINEILEQNPNI